MMIATDKTKEQLLLEIKNLQERLSYYEQTDLPEPTIIGSGVIIRAFYLSPVAMAITDQTGHLLAVNNSFSRITGYSNNELVGKTIFELRLFAAVEDTLAFARLIAGQEQEVEYRTSSRSYRQAMLGTEEFIYDDTLFILISLTDITARKLMEAEMSHSREQLQRIISASPAPICISTLEEGRYLDVNESFLRLTGYDRDEVIGKTIADINFLVGINRSVYVDKLVRGESVNNMDIMVQTKDGKIGYSLLSAQLYWIDDLPCILSTVIDVTENKLAEKALVESEARFHSVFHYSPTMMIITRADNGRILDANHAWLSTMGYELNEVLGHNVDELNTWVDDDRKRIVRCISTTGRLDNTDIRVRTKNGKILDTISSAVQTNVNNEPCVLIYSVDITEQKRMQNELARLDRLNLIGQMAASLGHEVRNPMTTVRGFLQMLQNNDEYRENHEYYQLMIEELDQGNKIITEFLTLASDKSVELLPLNLNNILEQIYPLLRAEALLQEKWINYYLDEEIPELLLDDKEIRQLIINLANNGLEAMAPGGCLEITTCKCQDRVIMNISDQGCGIPSDLRERIGTPFVTTKDNGVGLGLAICYSIAQRHGASIDFTSGPQGTTFQVVFKVR